MKQSYGAEEAEEILKRAMLRGSGGGGAPRAVSHRQLLGMAEELGISPEEVEAAIAEDEEKRDEETLRREFIGMRYAGFWHHLTPFLLVNLMLIMINVISKSSHPWALYPLMAWGIGLGSHAVAALPTRGLAFEKEFADWRRNQVKKVQRKRRTKSSTSQAESAAANELEAALNPLATTAEELMEATNRPVNRTVQPSSEEPAVLRVGQGRSGG